MAASVYWYASIREDGRNQKRSRKRKRASSLFLLLCCAAACPAGADLSACEVSLTSAAIKTPRRCTLVKRSISSGNIEDWLVWDLQAVTVWQRNYLYLCNTDSEVTGEDFPPEAWKPLSTIHPRFFSPPHVCWIRPQKWRLFFRFSNLIIGRWQSGAGFSFCRKRWGPDVLAYEHLLYWQLHLQSHPAFTCSKFLFPPSFVDIKGLIIWLW